MSARQTQLFACCTQRFEVLGTHTESEGSALTELEIAFVVSGARSGSIEQKWPDVDHQAAETLTPETVTDVQ